MRYLVTGGAGFIGSHLTEALVSRDHEVLVLDDFSTGRPENLAHLQQCDRLEVICASVTDVDLVRDCVPSVDAVFHLASAVGVRLIVDQPVKTLETNVEGAATVLHACADHQKPVLITSTSEVYGKSEKVPFSEDDDSLIGPSTFRRWSYAASKLLDEFLALAHWHQSRLPAVIVRLFNTIGPRQTGRYGMVVPRFVRQAMLGEPITVYGDGTQTRCFCHVDDAVGAILRLFDAPESRGQVFNVGTDEEVSVNELAATVRRMTGSPSEIRHVPYDEAYGASAFEDMARRVPDLGKIRRLIDYQPKRSLEQTLGDVIRYVRSELEKDERAEVGR
jgi:UDP-glucose 4-epimerase